MEKELKKIHCELTEKELYTMNLEEISECIGFYEVVNEDSEWKVTRIDGFYYAESQFEAESIANQEMILALLLRKQYKLTGENCE